MGMADEQAESDKLWAERVQTIKQDFEGQRNAWAVERRALMGAVDAQTAEKQQIEAWLYTEKGKVYRLETAVKALEEQVNDYALALEKATAPSVIDTLDNYRLDIAVVEYGDGMEDWQRRAVDSMMDWLASKLPHFYFTVHWHLPNESPVFKASDTEPHVDWTQFRQGDLTILLWKCPDGESPDAGGLTWPRQIGAGFVLAVPYDAGKGWNPQDVDPSAPDFETTFEAQVTHETKNALVRMARNAGRIDMLDTYGNEGQAYIECAGYPSRRACYEAVMAQFTDEVCRAMVSGRR